MDIPNGIPLSQVQGSPHRGAFLMLHTQELQEPELMQQTAISEAPPSAAELGFVCIPVERRGRSAHPDVCVGRTANNDVVLNDATVSKVHAFIRERDGKHFLIDAGSSNGTTCNGRPVPTRGAGEPVELHSQDAVRFGSVALTYLSREHVLQLA